METRNDADRVESGNSPPAEVRESEARATRIHSLLKLRDKAEAEIAGVLREHLDAVGELAWLAWCEREFGWKRRQAYNHLNPEQLQKDRDRKAEAYRAECAETPLIVAEPEPDPFFQEREADMKEGKVTLSAATSKWQRANGRLPDAKDDWETPLDL